MISFIFKRVLSAVPTLLILLALTFFLLRVAPGGPFDADRVWPPEIQRNIEAKYGLDQPVYMQFVKWLQNLSKGDLNESFFYVGTPVTEIISKSLPPSLTLGVIAILVSILIGIPLGVVSAWKQNSWLDSSAMFLAISGISLPNYLVASVFILVFAMSLGWVPPALWEGPSSAVLPIMTLTLRPLAIIARLTRASMIEVIKSDYIRTAYAKGMPAHIVLFKHALKNSLIPVVTLLGPLAANMITGSFVIEMIFQIPGIGKHFVAAVMNRDYPLVMGVTLLYGSILITFHLIVDLTYAWLDPRIRLK